MSIPRTHYRHLALSVGPGLLFAGAVIGASHLIQATRAGAHYGFKLIGLILLIIVLKYPFFDFATRYTAITQKSILRGYAGLGYWVLILFLGLTTLTALPTLAAVSFINANLASYIFDVSLSPLIISIGLLSLSATILLVGKYNLLDRTIKITLLALTIATLAAVAISLPSDLSNTLKTPSPNILNLAGFSFMLALMGWMPAPIEMSVWLSLWSRQKSRVTQYKPTLKEALFDFRLGYIGSTLLAIGFLALGALVMFGSGQSFSSSGVLFTQQLITLFTQHIGNWSAPLIEIIVFCTLFGTTLACLDGYPRSISATISLAFPTLRPFQSLLYWAVLIGLFFSSILLSGFYTRHMKQLVDLATIIAFLTAPIFGYLNYRVITHKELMPKSHIPPRWLIYLSHFGLIFLVLTSIIYVIWNLTA